MISYEKIWEKCSEEDIHRCIEEAFINADYEVSVLHKRDRRYENGVDIECDKEGRKIFFAVKKDPRKEDILQLKKLAKRNDVEERVYVYLKPPTKPFMDELKKHKSSVTVWNAEKLHKELAKKFSQKYLSLMIRATPLFINLLNVWLIIHSKRMGKPQKPNKANSKLIWDLKDRSCMLKGMSELSYNHYASIIKRKEDCKEDEILSLLDQILPDMLFINWYMVDFKSYLERLSQENPAVISLMWRKCYNRTTFPVFAANERISDEQVLQKEFTEWIMGRVKPSRSTYEYLISLLDSLRGNFENLEYCVDTLSGC